MGRASRAKRDRGPAPVVTPVEDESWVKLGVCRGCGRQGLVTKAEGLCAPAPEWTKTRPELRLVDRSKRCLEIAERRRAAAGG